MRQLGIRTFEDLIGRADLLEADDAIDHWKARGVDLTHILTMPEVPRGHAAAARAPAGLAARRTRSTGS